MKYFHFVKFSCPIVVEPHNNLFSLIAEVDYTLPPPRDIIIHPNTERSCIVIQITDDSKNEETEFFQLNLVANDELATIPVPNTTISILDNDCKFSCLWYIASYNKLYRFIFW